MDKEERGELLTLAIALIIILAAFLLFGCSLRKDSVEVRKTEENTSEKRGEKYASFLTDSICQFVSFIADSVVMQVVPDTNGNVASSILKIYKPEVNGKTSGVKVAAEQKMDSSIVLVNKNERDSVMNSTDAEAEKVLDLTTVICVAVAGVILLAAAAFFIWWKFRK